MKICPMQSTEPTLEALLDSTPTVPPMLIGRHHHRLRSIKVRMKSAMSLPHPIATRQSSVYPLPKIIVAQDD